MTAGIKDKCSTGRFFGGVPLRIAGHKGKVNFQLTAPAGTTTPEKRVFFSAILDVPFILPSFLPSFRFPKLYYIIFAFRAFCYYVALFRHPLR